jgi:hypothetical protein
LFLATFGLNRIEEGLHLGPADFSEGRISQTIDAKVSRQRYDQHQMTDGF